MVTLRMRELLILGQVYCRETGTALASLGRWSCRNREMFLRLQTGGGVNARSTEAATEWLITNWPDQIPWPVEVPDLRTGRMVRDPQFVPRPPRMGMEQREGVDAA